MWINLKRNGRSTKENFQFTIRHSDDPTPKRYVASDIIDVKSPKQIYEKKKKTYFFCLEYKNENQLNVKNIYIFF